MSQFNADDLIAAIPFAKTLGIELDSASPNEVTGLLPFDERICTIGGIVNGGALMSLADNLGAICAFLNLPEGATTATLESKTNLFRAARGPVKAVSKPLHVGRTTIVVQTDLWDEKERRIAQVTQSQAVLRG